MARSILSKHGLVNPLDGIDEPTTRATLAELAMSASSKSDSTPVSAFVQASDGRMIPVLVMFSNKTVLPVEKQS